VGVVVLIPGVRTTLTADSDTSVTPVPKPVPVRDGVLVVHGADTARFTVDVYEDFLCPSCGVLERRDGAALERAILTGELRVRYHPLPLLDRLSAPAGYSMDAANAVLCATDAGVFTAFHRRLFEDQPEEGVPGYRDEQFVKLAVELGARPGFAECVTANRFDAELTSALTRLNDNPTLALKQADDTPWLDPGTGRPVFRGAPTVTQGDLVLDTRNSDWLDHLADPPSTSPGARR
jgi:hypothetical protein